MVTVAVDRGNVMARIQLPEADLEEPYRLFMLAPNISRAAGAYSEAIYTKSNLPLRLRELMRMRIAQINQCVI
jgi:alkylhydroperoxidase family enzyme